MNKKSLTMALLGGALLFSGAHGLEVPASAGADEGLISKAAPPLALGAGGAITELAGYKTANASGTVTVKPAVVPAEETPAEAPGSVKLERVNGISLSDDVNTIVKRKGEPKSIRKDEFFGDTKILEYPDCSVAVGDYGVEYVEVTTEHKQITIDGKQVANNLQALEKTLGEPYWVAEDGLVYTQDNQALKLFVDPDTGQLKSVHFFSSVTE
ncbi:hypothetical protein P4H65_14280 [Paenibacillus chitinolyticus]|uniref:hypothetical protein n=1 Tax=Paenibacillus chitinolyticus TaxID=79263 RepID=UPI002DBD694E|nr:hypothetical protein [Paenibacillus chitinolyticus]MEC0246957.1 hypothetical protein [Paenibacillus chitinolyticus]